MSLLERASELHAKGLKTFFAGQNLDEAIHLISEAVALAPQEANYLTNLGRLHAAKKNWEEAKILWEKALQIKPDLAEALLNLGTYYTEREDPLKSEDYLKRALAISPDRSEIHIALGHRALWIGDDKEGYKHFERAFKLDPNNRGILQNLGTAYERIGSFQEALLCYRQVIEADDNAVDAKSFAGVVALLLEYYEAGWDLFEARLLDRTRYTPEAYWKSALPLDLTAKKVFLVGEQGLGDNIQFIRFAKMIKDRGAHITFVGAKSLLGIFSRIPFIDQVHEEMDVNSGSIVLPMMSLPHALKVNREKDFLPTPVPYVTADPKKIVEVGTRLNPSQGKIGICWRGNPKHRWDRYRSLPIEAFEPILKRAAESHLQIVSVQQGPYRPNEEALLKKYNVIQFELKDFEETAAVLHHLDRFICVDTSTAHLAGAMGKSVDLWVPEIPDWRWKLKGATSPWYPTFKIHRGSFQNLAASLA